MTDRANSRSAHARVWALFEPAAALEWTRVLRVHWPDWPGPDAIRAVSADLERGLPAALPAWAERARQAEFVGLSPDLYDRLNRTLDEIPAVEHSAHPDNDPDPYWPGHMIRPFDAETWRDWPWLVEQGWTDLEATTLLLTADDVVNRGT